MREYKLQILLFLLLAFTFSTFAQSPTSLHMTRKGKTYFYLASNGGFETITNIPMSALRCLRCHPGKLADNTPIDTATYQSSCADCHNFAIGNSVPDTICLRCHSRQKVERTFYTDKHRSAGFTCITCHPKQELHADGTPFNTMFDTTMSKTCQSTGCHANLPVTPADSLAHAIHTATMDCAACHIRSQVTCYNCHFDTEIWQGMRGFKRPIGQLRGFVMLGRHTKTGKIGLVNYQSLVYQGNKSFIGYGPYYAHTIMPKDSTRTCGGCHNNAAIQEYNSTGQIVVARWDSTLTPKTIVHKQGVIPIPPNYQTAFIYDFANYIGRLDTTYTNPAQWQFMKRGLDGQQMLSIYVQPLTAAQMTKLGSTIGIEPINSTIPDKFNLYQNYPNPFNPKTNIKFNISKTTNVTLNVYNMLGVLVKTLVENEKLNAGEYEVEFDGSNLASGVYFYRIQSSDFNQTMKMMLVK